MMAIVRHAMFPYFQKYIKLLPAAYTDHTLLADPFLLEEDRERHLKIYYTPFEYVNPAAKIIIAGITPGLHQMKRAYSTAMETSGTYEEVLRTVKRESSFHGTMRKNLVAMMDELKIADHLGIETCSQLFSTYHHLLHSTSILPHAVFYKGRNYNGSTPKIMKTPLLRKYAENYFPGNVEGIQETLIVPLGVNVQAVLGELIEKGLIPKHRLLRGFPHPSGGNGHRIRQFEEHKEQMMEEIREFFSSIPIKR
ncbi:hypothetical protein [Lysinibacillus odysseyi]|nr:hypothetical protein [Lysinibacillus odysseyi]